MSFCRSARKASSLLRPQPAAHKLLLNSNFKVASPSTATPSGQPLPALLYSTLFTPTLLLSALQASAHVGSIRTAALVMSANVMLLHQAAASCLCTPDLWHHTARSPTDHQQEVSRGNQSDVSNILHTLCLQQEVVQQVQLWQHHAEMRRDNTVKITKYQASFSISGPLLDCCACGSA